MLTTDKSTHICKLVLLALSILLCTVFFVSCGADDKATISDTVETPTTVMIYMQDTDFGTEDSIALADITEIESCGIDVTSNNLIILADSAFTKEVIEEEPVEDDIYSTDTEPVEEPTVYSLLKLTESGFEEITLPKDFDGSLSCFLNYGYTNLSTDEYALIMWNLSSASVFSRNIEEVYSENSSYLANIKNELLLSPFNGENKLSFIGFDSSYMASAEVAAICADHADYLIASEDAELPCGWDYSSLYYTGKTDAKTLCAKITEAYYTAAEDYLTNHDFHYRTISLSCLDLSYINELCDSINALFAKAKADVEKEYTAIALLRAAAHTVSFDYNLDYDIADLYDLSVQFASLYKAEADALCDVITKMTVSNGTNKEKLSGLSLYFPFENHNLFKNGFINSCKDLNFYSEYYAFLDIYTAEWDSTDYLDAYASLGKATVDENFNFSLALDQEIAKTYVNARYHLLIPLVEGNENELIGYGVFHSDFASLSGDVLNATFDGNTLFAKNTFGEYTALIPVEIYSENEVTKLIFDSSFYDYYEGGSSFLDIYTDVDATLVIARDNKTNDLYISDLCGGSSAIAHLYRTVSNKKGINTDNFEETDVGMGLFRAPSTYKNGLIKEVYSWPLAALGASSGVYGYGCGNFVHAEFDGILYAKTNEPNLFVIFEVTDAHGNRFCSEPSAFSPDATTYNAYVPSPIDVYFEDGDRMTFFENDAISMSISRKEYDRSMTYYIEAENKTDKALDINTENLLFNGNITDNNLFHFSRVSNSDDIFSISYKPYNLDPYGKAEIELDLENIAKHGILDSLFSLSFAFEVQDYNTREMLVKNQKITVNFSENTTINLQETIYQKIEFYAPFMGAMADEQVIFENDNVKITLIGCGKEITDSLSQRLTLSLRYENKSNDYGKISLLGAAFNGIFCETLGASGTLAGGNVYYTSVTLDYDDISYLDIYTINSMSLGFLINEADCSYIEWCDVDIAEYAKSSNGFTEGDEILFDKDGIRISYKRVYKGGTFSTGDLIWEFAIVNNTDKDISIKVGNAKINGVDTSAMSNYLSFYSKVGAHQKTYATLNCNIIDNEFNIQDIKEASFCFYIDSIDGNTFYYKTDEYTVYTK